MQGSWCTVTITTGSIRALPGQIRDLRVSESDFEGSPLSQSEQTSSTLMWCDQVTLTKHGIEDAAADACVGQPGKTERHASLRVCTV